MKAEERMEDYLPGSIVITGKDKFPGMVRISEQGLVEGTGRR
jgi:hypothetical protein